jgi:hypothetical protein
MTAGNCLEFSLLLLVLSLNSSFKGAGAFAPPPSLAASTLKKARLYESPSHQVIDFVEPETKVAVKLVGVMHYNPASLALAKKTIIELAEQNKLGSVVVELCDLRWKSAKNINPVLASVISSDMVTAGELALSYNRPVVLGDQRISATMAYMQNAFKETLRDIIQPHNGGWQRIASDVTRGWSEVIRMENNYLGPLAILDPKLLAGAPFSVVKYPLSIAASSPVETAALVLLFVWSRQFRGVPTAQPHEIEWYQHLVPFGFRGLQDVLFARVMLKEILMRRNRYLSQSILDQCRLYRHKSSSKKGGWLSKFLHSEVGPSASSRPYIVYAPDSPIPPGTESDKTVVAIVGLWHCNGILKLMKERDLSLPASKVQGSQLSGSDKKLGLLPT